MTPPFEGGSTIALPEETPAELYDDAPCGYATATIDGVVSRLNATLAGWLGHRPETLLGQRFKALLTSGGRIFFETHCAPLLLQSGDVPQVAIDLRRADGVKMPALVAWRALRQADGAVIGHRITVLDATERRSYERDLIAEREKAREAAEALRELNATLERQVDQRTQDLRQALDALRMSDDRLRTAFATSFVAQAYLDPDGTLREVNPTFLDVIDAQAQDVVGRPFWDTAWFAGTPDAVELVRDAVLRCVAGEASSASLLLDMPAGRRAFDFSIRPVKDEEGRVVGLVPEAVETTARLAVEEQLRQAKKMDAIGQLTGGIAHDFNNLLQSVVGRFDLILRKPNDAEKVRRWAVAGSDAAERGMKLTGQLLAFSRAQKLETKPFVVSDLVANMSGLLARTLGPLIVIAEELDPGDTRVLGDPTQFEMAILNLAINARDVMPQGGRLSIVTTLRTIGPGQALETGGYVEVAVTDTGSGMAEDVAVRAFEPFFTTKPLGQGTGLGLAQVYGMARQAGGTARIESAPGRGTTVRLLLRRTDRAVTPDLAVPRRPAGAMGAGAHILVVDDDAAVRRFLVDSLDMLGYRTTEAVDGQTAMSALEAAPDLMIVDFAMPGMTGAEVAHIARARFPRLPIVFASGYAETAAIEQVLGAGQRLLHKPFKIEELQAVVAEALKEARGKPA